MANTITRSQVTQLRTEAASAGDSGMVKTCDLALGAWSADEPNPEACQFALAECWRVICDAQAQAETPADPFPVK